MLLNAYAVLLAAAFVLNRHDRRMLLLTLVVGVSVFVPVPRQSAEVFYAFCISAELLVMFLAWRIKAQGSELVMSFSFALAWLHVMGYAVDGSSTLSTYRILVPMLEAALLVACVCTSPAIFARLQNRLP